MCNVVADHSSHHACRGEQPRPHLRLPRAPLLRRLRPAPANGRLSRRRTPFSLAFLFRAVFTWRLVRPRLDGRLRLLTIRRGVRACGFHLRRLRQIRATALIFLPAFSNQMFPGAGTSSILKPCIAPALLYTPSPPAETASSPTSYFSVANMFPSVFGTAPLPDPLVEEDKDELAALGLAMIAGGHDPHARASNSRPASPPADLSVASTSGVPPPRRPSLTKSRRRPRSESASDSGRGQTGPPSLRDLLHPGTSLPSPGISSGSDDDEPEEDEELSADEFVPGARRTSASSRGAGDAKKRRPAALRKNSGDSSRRTSGTKTRRQPREIAYNPDAVFELNEDHLYFLVTVKIGRAHV